MLGVYVCTPYRKPASLIEDNHKFNVLFSSARVIIEHVNGMIKSRFGSLMGIRILISKREDFARANQWIKVCITLYNMFRCFNDNWQDDLENDDEIEDQDQHADVVSMRGLSLRQRVQANLLQWYYNH